MGDEDVEPKMQPGDSGYRIRFEGDPPMEMTLTGTAERDGGPMFLAIPWTALAARDCDP